jgi:glucan phosphoethanolaminetransferase (alkaline phosphatase superfamily)
MAMWILSIGLAFGIYVKTAGFSNKVSTPIAMIDTILYKLYIDPYCGKRKSVTKSCGVSKINHIVFIVDESISAKYLSLNGYDKKTTPFLDSIADNILNYGFISSGANGSASSNMILMSGITLDELPDRSYKALKVPNIFQYAKKVGYTTSYISGQTRELQNYMSKYDIDTIDNFFKTDYTTFQLQKTPEKDIVDEVLKQINEHNKTFMFIVKRGAHFHYEHTYPQNNKVFSPTLKRDEPISLYNKKRVINSYCNAILWRVDGFFESLYRELHLDSRNDTIIIYTSDHGQSILENGTVATHNVSVNPNPSQGIVPLLVMPSSLDILHNKKVLKNHYTHFQLFPTLLWLMGYSDLNHTIFDTKISISQVFFSGDLFGRAGTSKTEISYE